jgi:tetraacyldisaccharide 4'-kinase
MFSSAVRGAWERIGIGGKILWLLLWPASISYCIAIQVRNFFYSRGWLKSVQLPRPVISVGNLTVGGTGKTPTCLWLAQELERRGLKVGILSRGYRRKETQPVILRSKAMNAEISETEGELARAGDEPLMMARLYGQTIGVGADRVRSAKELLLQEDVDTFILDDGFQHRHVKRDVDLVLLGTDTSACLLPAGPFREPRRNLRRADYWLLTGEERKWRRYIPSGRSGASFVGSLQPIDLVTYDSHRWKEFPLSLLHQNKILTVTGVANPQGFYRAIHDWEGQIVHTLEFPDHHSYTSRDWQEISRMARLVDLIVTTEKDILKLIRYPFARDKLLALRVGIVVENGEALVSSIVARVKQAQIGAAGVSQ